jgi:zinc/manganese transport system substrate-binding protein
MSNLVKALAITSTVLAMAAVAHAELKIVTTLTDYADLARQIGGDKVSVHSVMKGPENVHNVMATPTEMVKLNAADLFVHSGLDTEPWRDNLVKGARNPRIADGKPGSVDMSKGIELINPSQGGQMDRSKGDLHAYGNPHFTGDPANGMRMTATLARAMAAADPANERFYLDNAKKLIEDLADVALTMRDTLKPYPGLKVITFHGAWEYFARAAGIEVFATIEPYAGITPSPAQVQQLIDRAKAAGVKIVICETYNDRKLAQYISDQIGGKMLVLPDHVNGTEAVPTYLSIFRHNTAAIADAAKALGLGEARP